MWANNKGRHQSRGWDICSHGQRRHGCGNQRERRDEDDPKFLTEIAPPEFGGSGRGNTYPAPNVGSLDVRRTEIMRKLIQGSALALLVALAAASAAAQAQSPDRAEGEAKAKGGQEQAPAKGAPDSPPQHQVIGPPNAGPIAMKGEEPAGPGASPQTVPSTVSTENATKDEHWWLDRGLALSPEQKQQIYKTLARDGAQAGAGTGIFAEPSAVVPADAKLYVVPKELAAAIPYIEHFKYVVSQNKVVLVDPVNGVVAAVVGQ
jgi:hypothetical protein